MSELKERVRKQLGAVSGWLAQDRLAEGELKGLAACLDRIQPAATQQVRLELPLRIVAEGRGATVHADVRDVPGSWPSVEYVWSFHHRHWTTDKPTTFVETAGLPPGGYELTVTARRGGPVRPVDAVAVSESRQLPAQAPPATPPAQSIAPARTSAPASRELARPKPPLAPKGATPRKGSAAPAGPGATTTPAAMRTAATAAIQASGTPSAPGVAAPLPSAGAQAPATPPPASTAPAVAPGPAPAAPAAKARSSTSTPKRAPRRAATPRAKASRAPRPSEPGQA